MGPLVDCVETASVELREMSKPEYIDITDCYIRLRPVWIQLKLWDERKSELPISCQGRRRRTR